MGWVSIGRGSGKMIESWVPAMTALWDAADSLLNKDDLAAKEDYVNSMNWLAEVSGAGPINS